MSSPGVHIMGAFSAKLSLNGSCRRSQTRLLSRESQPSVNHDSNQLKYKSTEEAGDFHAGLFRWEPDHPTGLSSFFTVKGYGI